VYSEVDEFLPHAASIVAATNPLKIKATIPAASTMRITQHPQHEKGILAKILTILQLMKHTQQAQHMKRMTRTISAELIPAKTELTPIDLARGSLSEEDANQMRIPIKT